MPDYGIKTSKIPNTISGKVESKTTMVFDVQIEPIESAIGDEFVIQVNGSIVKRLNRYQANRMGLIDNYNPNTY